MKTVIKSIFLSGILALCSCGEIQIDEILAKEFPVTKEIKMVKHEHFEIDEVKTPVEMAFADSLIFFRNFSGDSFISVFNAEKGKFVCDIAPKGLGPDEFLYVSSLYKKDNGISFYDINLHKLFYAESASGKYDDVTYSSTYVPEDTVNRFQPMWICPLKNNIYYATGLIDDYRFALLDSTAKVSKRFGNYPDQENMKQYSSIALGFAFQGMTACNERADRMVIADNVGASIQFYNIENQNNPFLLKEYIFIAPQFRDDTTKDSWGVTFLKGKNIIGALSVKSYKNNVLILFSGANTLDEDIQSGNKLLVYTWDGKPKQLIELNKKCFLFAVDERNGMAYFLSKDEGYDYTVYKIDLSL